MRVHTAGNLSLLSQDVRYGATAFWLVLCLVALFTARVVGWFAGILVGALVAFVAMLVIIKRFELRRLTECAEKLSALPAWSERDETDFLGLEHK